MKKLLILILSLSMAAVTFASCNSGSSSSSSQENPPASSVEEPSSEVEEKVYTVTFVQDGQVVKTVEVKEGESVAEADIPTPTAKTGYTVVWEDVSLSNITADMEVKAVATANTYTITFDANGGEAVADKSVVYDSEVTLPTAVRTGYEFVAWLDIDGNAVNSGRWTIDSDVTLKADWSEVKPNEYTIKFVQDGQPVITHENVVEGTNFTDIPQIVEKTGYTVEWDAEALAQLSNVQGNVTVYAEETANTYKVTYSDAKGVFKGSIDIVYDSEYDWSEVPGTVEGYHFEKFTLEDDTTTVATTGIWKFAEDTTVVVHWAGNKYTVVFKVGSNGTCAETQMTVTYGEAYTLPTVTPKNGYNFNGWELNGTKIPSTGTWSYTAASTIELVAALHTEEWTKNY